MRIGELIGSRIADSKVVEDYLQLWFDNGACLSIYNEHEVTRPDGRAQDSNSLTGASLTQVREQKTEIRLIFSNGLRLSIDMSEEGYSGPEAIQLTRANMPPVVWRLDDYG